MKGQGLEVGGGETEAFFSTGCSQWMWQSEFPVNDSAARYSFGLWKAKDLLSCAHAAEAQIAEYTSSLSVALFCKPSTDVQLLWDLTGWPLHGVWHPTVKIFISPNLGLLVEECRHEDVVVDN